jgi:hypothetical protein
MEVFSDSGNSIGKVPLLCRYAGIRILMQVNEPHHDLYEDHSGIEGNP